MTLRGGIDLGGTKILAAVVNGDHRVLGQARRATPTAGGPVDVAAAMAGTLREALAAAQVPGARLAGIGVGSPGVVDDAKGTVAHAGNLPGWTRPYPLAANLSKAFGVPVRLGNDVGVAMEAEATLGAGRGHRSVLGLWWGTGIGGGLVLDGKRWVGQGAAGEIGHMVVEMDGARCPCGRRGCLEAYAGRRAMERKAREEVADGDKSRLFEWMKENESDRLTSRVWAKGLRKGDKLTKRLISRAEAAIAACVASVINLLDVDVVVVGGGMGVRMGAPFAKRLLAAMRPHLFVPESPPLVRIAALGEASGAIGAARLSASPRPEPRRAARRAR